MQELGLETDDKSALSGLFFYQDIELIGILFKIFVAISGSTCLSSQNKRLAFGCWNPGYILLMAHSV